MKLMRSYFMPITSLLGSGLLLVAWFQSLIPVTLAQEVAVESQPASVSPPKVIRSEEEWRALLSPEAFHVLREKGTERPFTNKYDKHFELGEYACAGCSQVLFESQTKFNSGCGWPAFYAAKAGDRVKLTPDFSFGMNRTEVTCTKCGSHLGHIFDDAPQTPTGQRYCINSVSLRFIPVEEASSRVKSGSQ